MSDTEVQVEVQLSTLNPPSGDDAFAGQEEEDMTGEELDWTEGLQNTGQADDESALSLLADVALALPCGIQATCPCDCEACCPPDLQCRLRFLKVHADYLQDRVVNGLGDLERLAAVVPIFLRRFCTPYFNQLESRAKNTMSQLTPLPCKTYSKRVRLLDFSQQLCDKLEQLILTYASYNLLDLDETKPDSISHFCIGQRQLGRLRLSIFWYCRPTPYLAQATIGLYKRMRWNVDRLKDESWQTDTEQPGQSKESEPATVGETEYYFLCYEEVPDESPLAGGDDQDVSPSEVVRMWSIGQWVQVFPDPDTEDICDWVTCEVPLGDYKKLLLLGSSEPTSSSATHFLQQLLLSGPTGGSGTLPRDS